MKNRKKQNLEIERKNKQRRYAFRGVTTLVVLALVAAIVWVAWDARNRGWVMTFDGDRISVSEMQFFSTLFQQNWFDPEGREDVLDRMVEVYAAMDRAERLGLGMTDEEYESMLAVVSMNRQMGTIPEGVTDERAAEIYGLVEFLWPRLRDHYVPEYTLNLADFAEELAEYVENNRDFYADTVVHYIASDEFLHLEQIRALYGVEAGYEDFDQLIREHSIFYSEEVGITSASIMDLWREFNIQSFDVQMLLELQEGEVSHVVEAGGIFLLIYVESRTEAEDSEIEDSFVEQMTEIRREQTFIEIIEQWAVEANYTINRRALNAL